MPGFRGKDKVFRWSAGFALKTASEKEPRLSFVKDAGDWVLLQEEIKGGDNAYFFHDG